MRVLFLAVCVSLASTLLAGCSSAAPERPDKDDYSYTAQGFCRTNVEAELGSVDFTGEKQFDVKIDGELKRVVTGVATDNAAALHDFRCELVWEDDDWSGSFSVAPR